MSSSPAALVVEGVTKTYGSGRTAVTAVQDVSLTLADREFVAVLGPSGSGKSTLLAIVGALLAPTTGEVRIGTVEVTRLAAAERTAFRAAHVGFVFQGMNLVPFLSARENLTMVGDLLRPGVDRAALERRADGLLEELDLTEVRDSLPGHLSAAERQRAAVARALVNDPQVLLVDEPTAGLGSEDGRRLVQLLARQITDRGTAGIMVTHDPRMVEYTDRTLEMSDGRLRALGGPDLPVLTAPPVTGGEAGSPTGGAGGNGSGSGLAARPATGGPHTGRREEGVEDAGGQGADHAGNGSRVAQ